MTQPPDPLPGSPRHQAFLQAVWTIYQDDPRVRAVLVFGSLGRGNWRPESDIDLNIILADGVIVDPLAEARRMCAAAGETLVLLIPDDDDACDGVLASRLEFSVRFHRLATLHPVVVESMLILGGELEPAELHRVADQNRHPQSRPPELLLQMVLRYALEVRVALQYGRLWSAVEILHRMRGLLMEIYAVTHGSQDSPGYAYRYFQANAPAALQARLAGTLTPGDLPSLGAALDSLERLLQNELAEWSAGALALSVAQRRLLDPAPAHVT